MAPPQTQMGRLILRELEFNVEISVKATCHKSIAAHSFLTHLIFPSPLHLSAQIVLLINYAIIPIGWLIAASSSAFPLQINSLTTVAATGWANISDAACATGASVSSSFWQMKLQRRASDLHQAASLPNSYWPTDTTTSVVLSEGSFYWQIKVLVGWTVKDFTSPQLQQCQSMRAWRGPQGP